MRGYPSEFMPDKKALEQRGLIWELDLARRVAEEWDTSLSRVRGALRRGIAQKEVRCTRLEYRLSKRTYYMVDPSSARKWLLFALDRIPDEWVMAQVAAAPPADGGEGE